MRFIWIVVLIGLTACVAAPIKGRTLSDVQAGFVQKQEDISAIFATYSRQFELPKGRIRVSVSIEPGGRVSDAHITYSSFNRPDLEQAIIAQVKSIEFVSRSGGTYTIPDYPIMYTPPKGEGPSPAQTLTPKSNGLEHTQLFVKADAIKTPANYYEQIYNILNKNVQYPQSSIRRGEQGTCRIKVEFARDGTVQASSLIQSAGFSDLDAECLAVVKRVSPFPAAPESITSDAVTFVLVEPLVFSLSDKK